MIKDNPDMESSLTLLTGLLSDACTNGDLRAMFIDSAKALSTQEKIVEKVQTHMQYIEIGKVILEEKKAEEAKAELSAALSNGKLEQIYTQVETAGVARAVGATR